MKAHRTCVIAMSLLAAVGVQAQTSGRAGPPEYNGDFPRYEQSQAADRVIVKWTKAAGGDSRSRLQKAAAASGVAMRGTRAIGADTEVLELPRRLAGDELGAVIERLQSDPEVIYASPDLRRRAHAVTSDPLLGEQWYLLSVQPAATRTEQAWDVTAGSQDTIVAVLDTGVRFDHPDLGRVDQGGKLLAGYDFIARPEVANDGDGRDADPSDPGDWVNATDVTQPTFQDCEQSNSSWHGTRVAGLIGALTNNAAGVAGAGWNTRVLPVRVLGKCGGFDSDIIAAMRWAAGLPVSGVPANPNPANIINLSLGADGACTAAYRNAVDEITARGTLIVASAGNDGGPVNAPANCPGVLGVAGLRHAGTKVGFSNLGLQIGLGAPGGNCVNTGGGQPCLFSIVAASNTGTTTPGAPTYTDQLNFNVGTSFSAPQAAAAAALMHAINARLTPAQLIALMKDTTNPFPPANSSIDTCHVPAGSDDLQNTECNCTTQTCGAGMLNAAAAVSAAQRPFAILRTSGTVEAGATLTIDGSDSFAANDRALTAFEWTVMNVDGAAPVIAAPAQANTTLQIGGAGQFTLRLTVTDDQGGQDSQEVALATPAPPPPPTPPPSTPSVTPPRSGGGALSSSLLALLLAAAAIRTWRFFRSPYLSGVSRPARFTR